MRVQKKQMQKRPKKNYKVKYMALRDDIFNSEAGRRTDAWLKHKTEPLPAEKTGVPHANAHPAQPEAGQTGQTASTQQATQPAAPAAQTATQPPAAESVAQNAPGAALPTPTASGVTAPNVADKPDKYVPPTENLPVETKTDFVNRGDRNLIDIIKEYGQPYDYQRELEQAERNRKSGLLADTIALAGNALASSFGANQIGQFPNAYKEAQTRLEKIRDARTKSLIDNRNLLREAAMKQYGLDREDDRFNKQQKQKQTQFEAREKRQSAKDEADIKHKDRTYQAGRNDAEQKRKQNEFENLFKAEVHKLNLEKAEVDRKYKAGQLSISQYKAKIQGIQAQIAAAREERLSRGDSSKKEKIYIKAEKDDKGAVRGATGWYLEVPMEKEEIDALAEEIKKGDFLKGRTDLWEKEPSYQGATDGKLKDNKAIVRAYLQEGNDEAKKKAEEEKRREAEAITPVSTPQGVVNVRPSFEPLAPPSTAAPKKPYMPDDYFNSVYGKSGNPKAPGVSEAQFAEMQRIANNYKDDDVGATNMLTAYLHDQGKSREEIKTILSPTK